MSRELRLAIRTLDTSVQAKAWLDSRPEMMPDDEAFPGHDPRVDQEIRSHGPWRLVPLPTPDGQIIDETHTREHAKRRMDARLQRF